MLKDQAEKPIAARSCTQVTNYMAVPHRTALFRTHLGILTSPGHPRTVGKHVLRAVLIKTEHLQHHDARETEQCDTHARSARRALFEQLEHQGDELLPSAQKNNPCQEVHRGQNHGICFGRLLPVIENGGLQRHKIAA